MTDDVRPVADAVRPDPDDVRPVPDAGRPVPDAIAPSPDARDSATDTAADDRLAHLRGELEAVGQRPIAERVEVFTAINDALVRELSSMEDVDSLDRETRSVGRPVPTPGPTHVGRDPRRRPSEGSRHEGPSAS